MDILNWLYLQKAKLIKTVANDATTDLVAIGADVTYAKRGDKYQTYGMTLTDAVQSGAVGNTAHYELDLTATSVVTVNTTRGIIDIIGMGTALGLTPAEAFGSSTLFIIDNPDLDLTVANRDNVYVQYSVYYKNTITDNAIPYLISVGASNGLEFNLYNANPGLAGVNNWDGALYIYFELYTIN
jgi:hypothetical protein